MTWTDRFRLYIDNYKEQMDARPLAQSPVITRLQAAYRDVVRAETSSSR